MRKVFLLLTVFLLIFSVVCVCAQDAEKHETDPEEKALSLSEQFPVVRITERFNTYSPINYYRFSPDVMFYEPIDLSYFPHETWNKNEWVLLGRWSDGQTYNQMIYTDSPAAKTIMHGTDTGESKGIYRDFYLYVTLFIEDNYPRHTGSCYVYYSDSLMIGLNESKGILIDPESGIYEATNSYGGTRHTTYTPTTISQRLDLLQKLNPDDYAITAKDIESSWIGAEDFAALHLDESFAQEWETRRNSFRLTASPEVKAYRVEVVRQDGVSNIYINGHEVFSEEDQMKTPNDDGILVPERVSYSYGPILNEGGLTVTCSVGDFILYGFTGLE